MCFCGKEKRDSGNWWKTCGMRDSREKGAGMRDQDPPFQTLFVGTAYRTETVKLIRQSSIDLCRVFWWSFASFHWRFRLFYLALLVDWGSCFYSGYHCSLRLFPDVASTENNKVFSSVQTCSLVDVNVGACLVTAVWSLGPRIGHFRVPKNLTFKARLSAKPLIWKWFLIIYDANKTHFHNKGFALSLVLKVRVFGTRKWPILKSRC